MNSLFRATYKRADESLRHLTFAAHDDTDAHRTALQWTCGDILVSIALDRHLQPRLELA